MTKQVVKSKEVTAEELTQINQFTTRKFTEEELYIFSVILCDNEIDRDFEQFPSESLHKLKELFVGKTGIFDHDPKGGNQTARIYKTEVVKDLKKSNQLGEPYEYLLAKAYMVKSEKNKGLILEVEGGIKKEVSIGCSVGKKVCSVCSKDAGECSHKKGEPYGKGKGVPCYTKLLDPTDAYEFSFVAIPAQRKAGVTKKLQKGSRENKEFLQEKKRFEQYKQENREFISLGKAYLQEEKKKFVRELSLKNASANLGLLNQIAEKLQLEELKELKKHLDYSGVGTSQFYSEGEDTPSQVSQFKI